MIIRILPINGLKGQQWLAQSIVLGMGCGEQTPCKGKRILTEFFLLPLQGVGCTSIIPRAMPWAVVSLPLRGVIG